MKSFWEIGLTGAGAFAEFLVAYAIFQEVKHGHDTTFLEKATRYKANKDRRKIYKTYLSLPGDRRQKAEAFAAFLETEDGQTLKHKCERQIAIFNDLGFSYRRHVLWFLGCENPLVSLLPHATIYLWVILNPFVLKRRADAGPWFSKHLLRFTLRSIEYVLRFEPDPVLRLRDLGGTHGDVVLGRNELRDLRNELERLLENVEPKAQFLF